MFGPLGLIEWTQAFCERWEKACQEENNNIRQLQNQKRGQILLFFLQFWWWRKLSQQQFFPQSHMPDLPKEWNKEQLWGWNMKQWLRKGTVKKMQVIQFWWISVLHPPPLSTSAKLIIFTLRNFFIHLRWPPFMPLSTFIKIHNICSSTSILNFEFISLLWLDIGLLLLIMH